VEVIMTEEIDEVNKIIHIKCSEEEKQRLLSEMAPYSLYDYQFDFIITDNTKA
jgi:hypothetical protein